MMIPISVKSISRVVLSHAILNLTKILEQKSNNIYDSKYSLLDSLKYSFTVSFFCVTDIDTFYYKVDQI